MIKDNMPDHDNIQYQLAVHTIMQAFVDKT